MDGTLFHDWPDQPRIDDPRPMIIDSFAGGGGASTGIEMAIGRSPDVAINHNPAALALHEARAREVAEFLRSHGAWEGGEFVTLRIDGCEYVIVDIGLRMLTPRELFNAQGFPRDYVIEGVWHQIGDTWTFKSFPKNVQVSCVGNSVAPDIAAALVSANCAHLKEKDMAA